MAVVGGLCAVVVAMVMIGWNVMITEKRRRAQLRRRRASRMMPRKHVGGGGGGGGGMIVSKRRGGWGSVETAIEDPADDACSSSSPHDADGRRSPPTPSTAPSSAGPSSAERCPPAPSPCSPSGPPCVFHDLVMILDAPALPSPRRKLPKLLEEIDTSTDNGFGVAKDTTLSPPGGCDLSQGFHLSAPWSPPPRRGFPHRISGGNRPRTFSEYTAGPSTTDSIPGAGPSFRHVRAESAMAGLSSVAAAAAAADEGRGGGGGGAARAARATRARGATYSDGDPFADMDMMGPFSNEQIDRDDILMVWPTGKLDLKRNIAAAGASNAGSAGGPACASPSPSNDSDIGDGRRGSRGRGGGGDGPAEREVYGGARPLYPYARTVLPVS